MRALSFVSIAFVLLTAQPVLAQAPEATPAQPAPAPEPVVTAPPPAAPPPETATPDPAAGAVAVPPVELPPEPEVAPPPPVPSQLKLELANGTSIRFGLLWHLQYEAKGNSANKDLSHNLFIRRFAILIGGTILTDFEYFFDTDFGDLFKAAGDESLKNGPGISTKDAFVTYKGLGDAFKIDGGLFLPPGSRNSLQGGGAQYSWDFFVNTYRHAAAFGNTANTFGRDLGVQARGLVADGVLEYRAGIFQGRRHPPVVAPAEPEASSDNLFRFAGRLQLNLLDPENGFFYGGTYLGTKRIASIGVAAEFQPHDQEDGSDFRAFYADGVVDLPIGGDGVTAQVNFIHRDGGTLLIGLPKQTSISGEAGYRFGAVKLSPIFRAEHRWGDTVAIEETDVGGGLAYWAFDHTSNLKAFYTRVIPGGDVDGYDQLNLQWQAAFY